MKTLFAGALAATLLVFTACADDSRIKSLEVKFEDSSAANEKRDAENKKAIDDLRIEILAKLEKLSIAANTTLGPDGKPVAGGIKLEENRPASALTPELTAKLADEIAGLLELRGQGGAGAANAAEVEGRLRDIEAKIDQASATAREAAGTAAEAKETAKQGGAAQLNKKFGALAAELGLEGPQAEAVRKELLSGRQASIDLLKTPTASGRVFANELVDAFIDIGAKREGAELRLQKLFGELSTEKIPGQDKTYMAASEDLKRSVNDRVTPMLDAEQKKKYMAAWGTDSTSVEFETDDPWTALYLERVQLAE